MDENEYQIEQFLMPFEDRLINLTQELRKFFREETKPGYELVGDSTISLNIGYGFTTKAWDCFCAIILYSKHINLSFPSGAFLTDPEALLQGSGKRIRHIKINSWSDLEKPGVIDIIHQAKAHAIAELAEPPKEMPTRTVVKKIGGIKKRPNKGL